MNLKRVALLIAAVMAATGALVGAGSAAAAPGLPTTTTATVVDAAGGVYWRSAPQQSAVVATPGQGVYTGNVVQLGCAQLGGAGPTGNKLWYRATNKSLPNAGNGWVNDHYLNTPGTAANPQPQTLWC